MEASAAQGQQAPADGGGAEGQDAAQDAQQPGFDPAELSEQLSGLQGGLDELRTSMEQRVYDAMPADEQPEAPEDVSLDFMDPNSPYHDPQQAAQQLLQVLGDQQARQIADAIAPVQAENRELRLERDADRLAGEFPELADEATRDAVFNTTRQWVEGAGLPPEAAGNYQVVKAVYMMGRAIEAGHAEDQQPDVPAAHLEGAGGASPAGDASGVTADDIFGPARRSVLPF